MPDGSATRHLYLPKLFTVFAEGYGFADFRKDAMAALTVAIVALPLSMAIAVASGVSPARGLFTAIVGGFVVSALGGSRFQIGGPAGAFIVLVAGAAGKFGIDGLLLTVMVSGGLLTLVGLSRLGSLIRHVPHAVTVGFTAGIALTIFASQLKELGDLTLGGAEPGPLLPKLLTLALALPTLNAAALGLGIFSAIMIALAKRARPNWPGMLIAVFLATLAAVVLQLPVPSIGSRFGGIPQGLPAPHLPAFTFEMLTRVFPTALSFTLLGGIESLLSAKVADAMARRQHRSNMELVAQGIANIASALFGGISVTGTIARTATNVRAGARSPLSGMMHAAFLLVFMVVAAPLASFIPLSVLSGLLMVVCWNMVEREEIRRLMLTWQDAAVLLTTFLLTSLVDLTAGIVVGCVLAAMIQLLARFVVRKSERHS